jgi:hypothetical protein
VNVYRLGLIYNLIGSSEFRILGEDGATDKLPSIFKRLFWSDLHSPVYLDRRIVSSDIVTNEVAIV